MHWRPPDLTDAMPAPAAAAGAGAGAGGGPPRPPGPPGPAAGAGGAFFASVGGAHDVGADGIGILRREVLLEGHHAVFLQRPAEHDGVERIGAPQRAGITQIREQAADRAAAGLLLPWQPAQCAVYWCSPCSSWAASPKSAGGLSGGGRVQATFSGSCTLPPSLKTSRRA